MKRVWAYWQFKNGSIAELNSTNINELPEQLYVAWDRSLGCEVAYATH